MKQGCKQLRIASVIIILLGAASIVAIRALLGADVDTGDLTGTSFEGI